jgi:hypothetical protein
MMDSRGGRVLQEGGRSMVDADEWAWVTDSATGDFDHLLIGTSLPVLLGPGMHHLQRWDERLCSQRVAMRMDCMASWPDESLLRRPPSEDR